MGEDSTASTGLDGSWRTGWWGVVLESADAEELATFYAAVLGWPIVTRDPGWFTIHQPETRHYLSFSTDAGYERPVWPAEPGLQRMMSHLDVGVSDLTAAVEFAVARGARVAAYQPQDDVRVVLDPAGHPFCLYLDLD